MNEPLATAIGSQVLERGLSSLMQVESMLRVVESRGLALPDLQARVVQRGRTMVPLPKGPEDPLVVENSGGPLVVGRLVLGD